MNESDLIETRRVLESWGDDVLSSMRNILSTNGKIASGNLISSLKYEITFNGTNLDIEFQMPEYVEFVNRGRKPGKMPPISSIQQWTQIKGIPQKAAFPIAKKIAKEGIKATPFFADLTNVSQVRLMAVVDTAGSTNSKLIVRYKTGTFSTNKNDYSVIGDSSTELSVSLVELS